MSNDRTGLDGEQEVPPITTAATGGCMGVLDEPAAEFAITCAHDVEMATAAHIHDGIAGMGGPVVFDLGDPSISPFSATWTELTANDIADLMGGAFYVNIHSKGNPSGEIRGQIVERTIDSFVFLADESQQVPPSGSSATGKCSGDLSDDATMLTVSCSHDVSMPTAAHIHNAPTGVNGPVIFNFGDPTSPFMGTASVSPADVAEFVGRFYYVNIHSEAFPGGEIRGQMVAELLFEDGFESGDTSSWSTTVP